MSLGYIHVPLPREWSAPLLTDLTTPKQWKTIPTKALLSEGYTVYGANGKIGYFNQYTHEHPTIMITCRGATCGNLNISEPFSYINGNAMALDGQPVELVGLKFLHFALKARGLEDTISGSAQPQITGKGLSEVRLPLPPLAEQKIISDKLYALLSQVDNIKARLERVPQILKRFRQSVLAAAVSGRLTEEWRIRESSDEWQSIQLEKLVRSSANGLSKRKGDEGVDTTILRLADFKDAIRIFGSERKIKLTEKERNKYSLCDGDILVIRVNGSADLAGRFIQYDKQGELEGFCDHFIRMRLDTTKLLPRYLTYVANEGHGRNYLQSTLSTSAGQNTINQGSVKGLNVPLPSIEEQTEIVRRVDQLFAYAERIEQQVNNTLPRVNNLAQSILAKAFRGELTEEWRKDNPDLISGENSAEALLEKIKAERLDTKPAKRRSKKTMTV